MQHSVAEPEQPTCQQQSKALPAMLSMHQGLTVGPQAEASQDSISAKFAQGSGNSLDSFMVRKNSNADVIDMAIDEGAMTIPAGGETEVNYFCQKDISSTTIIQHPASRVSAYILLPCDKSTLWPRHIGCNNPSLHMGLHGRSILCRPSHPGLQGGTRSCLL